MSAKKKKNMTHDTWHMGHKTSDTLHVTHGGGGGHSLKMPGTQLLRFGIDSVLEILNKWVSQLMNQWINYENGNCERKEVFQALVNSTAEFSISTRELRFFLNSTNATTTTTRLVCLTSDETSKLCAKLYHFCCEID